MGTPRRRGSALLAALITVSAIAVLGAGLVQVSTAQLRRHTASVDTKRALYAAEAGLAEAWFAIAQGKSGNVASAQEPASFHHGLYWVEATWLKGDRIALRSTGLVGSGRFSLETVLERPKSRFAELGVFGDKSILIRKKSVVDGWDSAGGAWIPNNQRSDDEKVPVRVHSNGRVTARGITTDPLQRTKVFGDLQPGPDSDLTLGAGVLVTGATAPTLAPTPAPPIEVPQVTFKASMVVSANLTLTSERTGYESLRVASGASLTLVGPLDMVLGELVVEPTAEIVFDGSAGPVAVYVQGAVHLPAGAGLSTSGGSSASAALFMLEGVDGNGLPLGGIPQTIDFAPEGEFRGLLLAPGAHLIVPASLRLFGAIAAGKLELAEGSRVTFDVESERSIIGARGLPRFVCWRVMDLPDETLVRRRLDAKAQLALAGISPIPSSQAHWERELDMVYLDLADAQAIYSGDVDSIDWSLVKEVLSLRWTDSPEAVNAGEATDIDSLLTGDSGTIKNNLLAASPLSSSELYQSIIADPGMTSSDLKDVLLINDPLAEHVLMKATDPDMSPLSSSDLRAVLIDNSPLSGPELARLDSTPQLSAADKQAVLDAQ